MHNRRLAKGLLAGVCGLLLIARSVFAQAPATQVFPGPDCFGVVDSFTCPAESTNTDTALSNMLLRQHSNSLCFGFLKFDELPGQPDCNGVPISAGAVFVHRLAFVVPSGGLTAVTLTFQAKAAPSGETSTDLITFFDGATYIAGAKLRDLPGAFGTWNPNQTGMFSLELSNLPAAFREIGILQFMTDGHLGVYIGPNTGVDGMCLQTCTCPCRYDPQCDGGTNDVLDVVYTIDIAFRGVAVIQDSGCPKERTDVDASGVTDVIDVIRVINVVFRGQPVALNFVDPCAPAP